MNAAAAIVEARARNERRRGGYLDARASILSAIAAALTEAGLGRHLRAFWNGWSRIAENPETVSARSSVLGQAQAITEILNSASGALAHLAHNVHDQLAESIAEINAATMSVGQLNAAIRVGGTEHATQSLRDERDALLAALAYLGGTEATESADGAVTVVLGGETVVAGQAVATAGLDSGGVVTVGQANITPGGGNALAESEALLSTIPSYLARLDRIASSLAQCVNSAHDAGSHAHDAGSHGHDAAGHPASNPFFSGDSAATLRVAAAGPREITDAESWHPDASIARRLAALAGASDGPDAAYRELVAAIEADQQIATVQSAVQASVTRTIDSLRARSTGTNRDEVAKLLSYRRDCNACSRVLSAVDEALEALGPDVGEIRADGEVRSPDASIDAVAEGLAYAAARRTMAGIGQLSLYEFTR